MKPVLCFSSIYFEENHDFEITNGLLSLFNNLTFLFGIFGSASSLIIGNLFIDE